MFPVSIIIDATILAILVLFALIGRSRGLFRSLMGLVIILIALVVASRISNVGVDFVIDHILRPVATQAMEQRVDEMMTENITETSPLEEMERVIDAIPNDFIREKTEIILQELGLSTERMPGYSARDTLLELGSSLLDTVLDTAVRSLLQSLFFFVVFAVVLLLLRLLVRAVDITLRLPLVRQVNRFGGLLFGGIEGLLLAVLCLRLLSQFEILITPQQLQQSYFLGLLSRWIAFSGNLAG